MISQNYQLYIEKAVKNSEKLIPSKFLTCTKIHISFENDFSHNLVWEKCFLFMTNILKKWISLLCHLKDILEN